MFCSLAVVLPTAKARTAWRKALKKRAMTTAAEDPFEKTFRLVCRLDDAEIDYVRNTSEWITRCVCRVLKPRPFGQRQ